MNLSSIKAKKSEKGFTIVELLIVIVVIGILAASVIVAFNGVQARAKLTAAKAAASSVMKKFEAYNAATGAYPASVSTTTHGAMTTLLNANSESALSDVSLAAAPTDSNGQTTVAVYRCTTAGVTAYSIGWWDYTATTPALVSGANGTKAGPTCAAWALLAA